MDTHLKQKAETCWQPLAEAERHVGTVAVGYRLFANETNHPKQSKAWSAICSMLLCDWDWIRRTFRAWQNWQHAVLFARHSDLWILYLVADKRCHRFYVWKFAARLKGSKRPNCTIFYRWWRQSLTKTAGFNHDSFSFAQRLAGNCWPRLSDTLAQWL